MKRRLIASLRMMMAIFVALFATNFVPVGAVYANELNTQDKKQCADTSLRLPDESKNKCEDDSPVPGDNGDVKIHNKGVDYGDQRDEPKVCEFYLDAFNFDTLEKVSWWIATKPKEGNSPVKSGDITLSDGYGHTDNMTLPEGQYKLHWTFEGEHGSAKHKVFKVECESSATEVRASGPSSTPITCDEAGSYTLPDDEGVMYYVDGEYTSEGTYDVTSATTLKVTAVAQKDYQLKGRTSWTLHFKDAKHCEEIVRAEAPTMKDITCEDAGSYTIPSVEGVQYMVEGTAVSANTYPVSDAQTVHITAKAMENYKLIGQHSWNLHFKEAKNCEHHEGGKGSITIKKDAQPDSNIEFRFKAGGEGLRDFGLRDDRKEGLPSKTFDHLKSGEYTVRETAREGWYLKDVTCTGNSETHFNDKTGILSIKLGNKDHEEDRTFTRNHNEDKDQHVVCTFVNKKKEHQPPQQYGTIVVHKKTMPKNDKTVFSARVMGEANYEDGDSSHRDTLRSSHHHTAYNQTKAFSTEDAARFRVPLNSRTSYSVTELPKTGWKQVGDIMCTWAHNDHDEHDRLSFRSDRDHASLDASNLRLSERHQRIDCWVTNKKLASLTIVKQVTTAPSTQVFAFTTTGTGLSNFSLDDNDASALSNSRTFANLDEGEYTVTESQLAGWNLAGVTCSDGATMALSSRKLSVTLAAGDNVTCTFNNAATGGRGGDTPETPTPPTTPQTTPTAGGQGGGFVLGSATVSSTGGETLVNTGDNSLLSIVAGFMLISLALGTRFVSRRQLKLT